MRIKENYLFLSVIFIFITFLFINFMMPYKTTEIVEEEINYTETPEKEVIYIEIPYIYYDEELANLVKADAYENYVNKLTEENAEYWWYGYQIMIQNWEDQPEHLTDIYSDRELEYLYRCVETEVYGGDFLSKAHVAMVIFNRLERGDWGNTLTEVVTSPNQFRYGRTNITEQTKQACAFAFEMPDMTENAIAFHSGDRSNTFWGREYIFTDASGHHFYR